MIEYFVIVNLYETLTWKKIHKVKLISEVVSRAYDNMSCLYYSNNLCSKTTPEFTISVLSTPLCSTLDPLYLLTASEFIYFVGVNCYFL